MQKRYVDAHNKQNLRALRSKKITNYVIQYRIRGQHNKKHSRLDSLDWRDTRHTSDKDTIGGSLYVPHLFVFLQHPRTIQNKRNKTLVVPEQGVSFHILEYGSITDKLVGFR